MEDGVRSNPAAAIGAILTLALAACGEAPPPTVEPGAYVPFRAAQGAAPEMANFGTGFHTYVTGLTHDERGLPATDDADEHTRLVRRLVDKVRSFPKDVETQCIADRDYEALELAGLNGQTTILATANPQFDYARGLDLGQQALALARRLGTAVDRVDLTVGAAEVVEEFLGGAFRSVEAKAVFNVVAEYVRDAQVEELGLALEQPRNLAELTTNLVNHCTSSTSNSFHSHGTKYKRHHCS